MQKTLAKKKEFETKIPSEFKQMNDSRKISKDSARSFVGIESFSDDGTSQEELSFGRRRSENTKNMEKAHFE